MKIGVIGAGVMGQGIAQVCAQNSYSVLLFDISIEMLEKAKKNIEATISKGRQLGKITEEQALKTINNISYTSNISEVEVDLVIEAIVENINVKTQVFRNLYDINGKDCIYASNTSSIPITSIAKEFPEPSNMVGIHFFNPAHIMKLVEVIPAEQTSMSTLEAAGKFVASIGKTAVIAKDAPGFIVNRVARHYYVESLKILEEQVADFQTIDELLESVGFKLGVFKLMDLIGVETNLSVTQSMYDLFNQDPKFRPSRIQQKKVQAGYFGRKTKKGFYTYE